MLSKAAWSISIGLYIKQVDQPPQNDKMFFDDSLGRNFKTRSSQYLTRSAKVQPN
jgi:hypothetical protein